MGEKARARAKIFSAVVLSGFDAIKWTSRERFEQPVLTFTSTSLELNSADWAKMFVMPGFEPFLESSTVKPSGEYSRNGRGCREVALAC